MNVYSFDTLADRREDHSKKWCRKFLEQKLDIMLPYDFLSLWIADMDFKIAPSIEKKMKEILEKRTFGYIYCYDDFYSSVITWIFDKTNRTIQKQNIILNHGVVPTIASIVQCYCKSNNKVIINSPVYGPFLEVPTLNQCEVHINPLLLKENRYYLDFNLLEKQFKDLQPKLFIFCSPLNPSGRVWSKNEIINIVELCNKYNVLLVIDEVHSDHIYKGPFFSVLELSTNMLQNTIVLNSPNKAFNFAGLKTSYSIILNSTLNHDLQLQLQKQWMTEPNVYGIACLIAAYSKDGKDWVKQSYKYIIENYLWCKDFIEQYCPALTIMPMESSYLLWVSISKTGLTDKAFVRELAKYSGVILQEGTSFGSAGENFVRINLATSRTIIQNAFYKIKNFLEKIEANENNK